MVRGSISMESSACGNRSKCRRRDAIKRANSAEPEKIREALTQTKDLEGSAGSITINAERNADKDAVFKTVKDGKFVFLTTVKP